MCDFFLSSWFSAFFYICHSPPEAVPFDFFRIVIVIVRFQNLFLPANFSPFPFHSIALFYDHWKKKSRVTSNSNWFSIFLIVKVFPLCLFVDKVFVSFFFFSTNCRICKRQKLVNFLMLMRQKARCFCCSRTQFMVICILRMEIFGFLCFLFSLGIIISSSDSIDIYMAQCDIKDGKKANEENSRPRRRGRVKSLLVKFYRFQCEKDFLILRKIFLNFSHCLLINSSELVCCLVLQFFQEIFISFSYSPFFTPTAKTGFIGFCAVCVGESLQF